MRRGPKPTPTSIRLAKGNPGKRPLNHEEPEVQPAELAPPPVLEGEAREKWLEMAPLLRDAGLLTAVDTDALVGYCMAYQRWVKAEEAIKEDGAVITAPSGYPMQSPYVSIADRALAKMQSFHSEFGMTPSARSRVKVKPRPNKSSDAERQRERFFGVNGGRR